MILIGFAFMFLVWPYIGDWFAPAIQKWVAMGMMLICILPLIIWEVVFPPSIDITAYSKSVDYEFRDSGYAEEFAELNQDAEWVKIE